MSDHALQIRSFAVVFDLERRIHRIDRFKIPLPYGLPLQSLGYTAAGLLAILVADGLPIVGSAVGALPAPLRLVLAPVAVGVLLTRLRLDGRSAHAACLAWLRFTTAPRQLTAFRSHRAAGQTTLGDVWCLSADDQAKAARSRWWRVPRAQPAVRLEAACHGGQLTFDGVGGEQLVMW